VTLDGVCIGSGDAKHLCGNVDANDLTGLTKIVSERERGLTQTAPNVEEPFALDESQLFAFPCPQTQRCGPPRGRADRFDEHSDVRIIIHPLVAESMRVVAFDGERVRQRQGQDRTSGAA
jgi:hypothetical protein